jgi:hypothetical protein
MRRLITAAILGCFLFGCSDDGDGKKNDAAPSDSQVELDAKAGDDATTGADASTAADGPVAGDAASSAWSCALEPGGGPFTNPHADGCRWTWKCPSVGDRQLYCETVSEKSHTCSCKNLTQGKITKTFKSVDICTFDEKTIAAEANKHCGWQLPVP